jgi:ATP-dependent Clp protease adaptor protein ClpS
MYQINFENQYQEQTQYDELLLENRNHDLVLFNDEVNTFDWVIESLIEICNHEPLQAEQSALIVHYKGKCTVKSGEWEELEVLHRELANRDLSVEIF